MMMAAANPGDEIAVPRNSHKSMLGGLVMSGALPVYMQPEVDEELHMDHCVTPETVARTLAEHPEVDGGVSRFADVLRRRRRSGGDRTHRARRRQTAAGRRSVGAALPLSPGAAALGHPSRSRSLHQLDAQDAVGIFAVRDAAPKGRSRAARPAQSRAQDVSVDVSESADGRVARRRAQADGDRGRAHCSRERSNSHRRRAGASIASTASTVSATTRAEKTASSTSIRRRSP